MMVIQTVPESLEVDNCGHSVASRGLTTFLIFVFASF